MTREEIATLKQIYDEFSTDMRKMQADILAGFDRLDELVGELGAR